MLNNKIPENEKLETQEEIGVVNNEPENRDSAGSTPIEEEVGVVNNEPENRDKTESTPVEEEIGVVNNETPGKGEPGEPIVGRIYNEKVDQK